MYSRLCAFALAFVMLLSTAVPAMASTVETFSDIVVASGDDLLGCFGVDNLSLNTTDVPRMLDVTCSEDSVVLGDKSEHLAIENFSARRVTIRLDFIIASSADFWNNNLRPTRSVYVNVSHDELDYLRWDCGFKASLAPSGMFPPSRYFPPYPVDSDWDWDCDYCDDWPNWNDWDSRGRMRVVTFLVEPLNNLTLTIPIRAGSDGGRFHHWQGPSALRVDGFSYGQVVTADEVINIVKAGVGNYAELFGTPFLYRHFHRTVCSCCGEYLYVFANDVVPIDYVVVDRPRAMNYAGVYFPLRFAERTLTFYVFEFDEESTLSADTTETARGSFTTTLDVALSLDLNRICGGWLSSNLSDYHKYWESEFPLYGARYVGEETVFLVFKEGACPNFGGMCRCVEGDISSGTPPPRPNVGNNTNRRDRTDDTSIVATVGPKTGDVAAPPFAHIAALAALVVVVTSIALVRGGERGVRKKSRLADRLVAVLRVYEA